MTDEDGYEDFDALVDAVREGDLNPADISGAAQKESYDPDKRARQEEGWFSIYLECHECHSPLHRVGTVGKDDDIVTQDGDEMRRSRTHIVGVCPDCGKVRAGVQMVTLRGQPFKLPWPDDPAWTWWFEGADDD